VLDLADRLRRLPESRLKKVAVAAHELAQALADAAAGVEARAADRPPPLRPVPRLSVFALGDQIAVTVHDLADAAAGLDAAEPVWRHGAKRPLAETLDALAEAAQRLRAQL
jgi:hypothetical protein